MRRKMLSLAVLLVPVGAFAYPYFTSYLTDDFDVYLQAMGYNPLHPPRNEFRLGSLYDIDENGNLDVVCPTTAAMADPVSGPDSENINWIRSGSFSVLGEIADRLRATVGEEYTKKVKLSLRDIRLLQIPASKDGDIQGALMSDRSCARAVANRLRVGHYICQVQSSFSAIAVYEIDDTQETSATAREGGAGTAPSADKGKIRQALTDAVQAHDSTQTKESGNSVLTGNLVFGVKLEPVCISPLNAIFVRTWSRSAVGRGIDYVKYEVIEPLFVKDLFGEAAEAKVASQ
jgi:hypothetical protein